MILNLLTGVMLIVMAIKYYKETKKVEQLEKEIEYLKMKHKRTNHGE